MEHRFNSKTDYVTDNDQMGNMFVFLRHVPRHSFISRGGGGMEGERERREGGREGTLLKQGAGQEHGTYTKRGVNNASQPLHKPFYLQVLVGLARRVESLLVQRNPPRSPVLRLEGSELEDSAWTEREIDKIVLRHVCAGRKALHGALSVGITVDKANVRGMDLMNGLIGSADVAMILPPQVRIMTNLIGERGRDGEKKGKRARKGPT